MSSCLGRGAVPVKRVWRGLNTRLGRRRATTGKLSTYVPVSRGPDDQSDAEADDMDVGALAGLGLLRKEVHTCEYGDVHVMWEMLSVSNTGSSTGSTMAAGKATATARKRRKSAAWSRLVSYCCAL